MAFICSPESKAVYSKYWLLTQPLCYRNKNAACELVMQSIMFIAIWAVGRTLIWLAFHIWAQALKQLFQGLTPDFKRLADGCEVALLWCSTVLTERILQLSAFHSSIYITVHIKGSAWDRMMKPLCQRCREVTSFHCVCFAEVLLPSSHRSACVPCVIALLLALLRMCCCPSDSWLKQLSIILVLMETPRSQSKLIFREARESLRPRKNWCARQVEPS